MTEAEIQQEIRKLAAERGWAIWRNNQGAGKLENGSFLRWGLCNDFAALGARVRCGDLIGIRPVLVVPGDVGQVFGQFVSIGCKASSWRPGDTEHRVAQRRWRDLILGRGGHAVITNRLGEI